MEKKFNRSTVKEISQKVQEVLSEYLKTDDFEFTINGGSFTDDKVKLTLEVQLKDSDGSTVVSDASHSTADSAASCAGLKFEGHLIGSMWNVKGSVYTVTGYYAKRWSYPIALKRTDGYLAKAPFSFLKQGEQIVCPTALEFFKWFTMDPDSDAILESDAEICDRVQLYMESTYPSEVGDQFLKLVDKLNDVGIAKKWSKKAYDLLFLGSGNIEQAYIELKAAYRAHTRKEKSKSLAK